MIRVHRFFMLSTLVLLVGCSRGAEDSSPVAETVPDSVRSESWRESRMLVGQETYEAACASCHDEGEGNAPVIGNKEEWSGRSDLWIAVLSEHANEGYLEMPEKGGHSQLSEDNVAAAAEYMLLKTFPEMPRD